jgi:hypothetical protein
MQRVLIIVVPCPTEHHYSAIIWGESHVSEIVNVVAYLLTIIISEYPQSTEKMRIKMAFALPTHNPQALCRCTHSIQYYVDMDSTCLHFFPIMQEYLKCHCYPHDHTKAKPTFATPSPVYALPPNPTQRH